MSLVLVPSIPVLGVSPLRDLEIQLCFTGKLLNRVASDFLRSCTPLPEKLGSWPVAVRRNGLREVH